MTTPAVTIQDCIDFADDNIGQISYDAVVSVKLLMASWINTLFGAGGTFTDVTNAGQRRVIDWHGMNNMAYDSCEDAIPGGTGLEATSNVIDAVTRTCYAVRDARIATAITAPQQTAVIAAFNLYWT